MHQTQAVEFVRSLSAARSGDAAARGLVLARYESYLNLLARLNLGQVMQAKVSRSDLVQETFLQAQKNFSRFRGTTEPEMTAWLRKILAAQIAQHVRYHHRERRDVKLERRLADDLDRSSRQLAVGLVDTATSPSLKAVRAEREVLLAGTNSRDVSLWQVPAAGGKAQALGITMPALSGLRIHPDGRRILFVARSPGAAGELWAIDNVLAHLNALE